MAESWSREKALALAPDASAASAGSALGAPEKWLLLGRSDNALWGEIKGSGTKPYQTRIDLAETAFKCSCPSRKLPCKHSLGLLLIYATQAKALPLGEPPAWVSEWLGDRQTRAAKKKTPKAESPSAATPRDEAAAARRAAAREAKIAAGLDELALWMRDLVRQGLGAAQALPSTNWENMAARLVDAQAPGLARRVRDLAALAFSGEGWQERLLVGLGRLTLLVEAYRRIEQFPPELAADVRTEVGWTRSAEEVLAGPGVPDTWAVLGQRITQEDQLRVQRTWLLGRDSGRPALLLQFAVGAQPFDVTLQVGTSFAGELAFFPGAAPLRALLKGSPGSRSPLSAIAGRENFSVALDRFSEALARQPWIERWPLAISAVAIDPQVSGGDLVGCFARDDQHRRVRLEVDGDVAWQLTAIAGQGRIDLFGEWNGDTLLPLSASADQRFYALMATEHGRAMVCTA